MEAQAFLNGSASIFEHPCKCFSAASQQPQVAPPRPLRSLPRESRVRASRPASRHQSPEACGQAAKRISASGFHTKKRFGIYAKNQICKT